MHNDGYCTGFAGNQQTQQVVTAITLPSGQQYQFLYDSTYGLLQKIIYPSGAYVSYDWASNPLAEFGAFTDAMGNAYGCQYIYDSFAIAHRYVSFDGQNVAQQQDFSYSTSWNANQNAWTVKQTTVTTHDLARGMSFQTIYTYSPYSVPLPPNTTVSFGQQVPLEKSIAYYDWNGTLLKTVAKTWFDQYVLTDQKVTLDSGQTSETSYTYTGCQANICYAPELSEKDEYDYGGALLRKTTIGYASFGISPTYPFGASILDRPSSTVTYDGSGNRAAETDYSYDGVAVGGNAGYAGHDDANYGTTYNNRGNATSKTEWLNTGGASPVTAYTHDLTGQMVSKTDANHNVTS